MNQPYASIKRTKLQFSLRSMLVITTGVGVFFGLVGSGWHSAAFWYLVGSGFGTMVVDIALGRGSRSWTSVMLLAGSRLRRSSKSSSRKLARNCLARSRSKPRSPPRKAFSGHRSFESDSKGGPYAAATQAGDSGEWTGKLDTTLAPNGEQTLTVLTENKRVGTSITVKLENELRIFFADLHAHTSYSDGTLLAIVAHGRLD